MHTGERTKCEAAPDLLATINEIAAWAEPANHSKAGEQEAFGGECRRISSLAKDAIVKTIELLDHYLNERDAIRGKAKREGKDHQGAATPSATPVRECRILPDVRAVRRHCATCNCS